MNGYKSFICTKYRIDGGKIKRSKTNMDKQEYDFACLSSTIDSTCVQVWMEEDIFYGIKRNEPIARTALFHELGHYLYNHLQNGKVDMDAYDHQRQQAIQQGFVLQQEVEADKFAVRYLGAGYVAEGLRTLVERSQQRLENELDDDENNFAIQELNKRIEIIEAYGNQP